MERFSIIVINTKLIKEINNIEKSEFPIQICFIENKECILISKNLSTFSNPIFSTLSELKNGTNKYY